MVMYGLINPNGKVYDILMTIHAAFDVLKQIWQ